MTFFFKFIFPAMWIPGFGAGALATAFGGTHVPDSRGFLFVWVIGSLFLLWGCAPLKKVRLVGSEVCVSNYLKEVCIPAQKIGEITENRWINIHPITIHFRDETPFGRAIRFMPRTQLFSLLSHPIVRELRELAAGAPPRPAEPPQSWTPDY